MITLERNGWRVTRRIGVGDRELVRSGLLQVGLMSTENAELQVEEALTAARRVGKTLRVYVNATRLSSEVLHRLTFVTMGRARDHDLMPESNPSREHFNWVLDRCDIIVERTSPAIPSLGDLAPIIKDVWVTSGGRHQLDEKAWRKTEAETRALFPEMYVDDDRLWELWSNG